MWTGFPPHAPISSCASPQIVLSSKFVLLIDISSNLFLSKTFKTVEYEGTNGWQINSFVSDLTGENTITTNSNWVNFQDTTAQVYSYTQGQYDSAGNEYPNATVPPFFYAGFNRKENKYVANLINNSTAAPGEINFGSSISGIKGFVGTVTIATDTVTNNGAEKELFNVSSDFIANNGY